LILGVEEFILEQRNKYSWSRVARYKKRLLAMRLM
jgi:hypothetical protein